MQTSLLKFFSKTPKGKSLGAAGSGGDTALSPKTTNTVEKNQRYYCLSYAVISFTSWEINSKILRKNTFLVKSESSRVGNLGGTVLENPRVLALRKASLAQSCAEGKFHL
jgi:hypothetical protein